MSLFGLAFLWYFFKHQATSPRTVTFDARSGPVAPVSDQGTRALAVAKEGTYANTDQLKTEKLKEIVKTYNEFSDLKVDYTIQEFEFEKANN